jgi:hypothetical protein
VVAGIEHALALEVRPDRNDAPVFDRHIGTHGRRARPIDDRPAPDHQIGAHASSPRVSNRVSAEARRR